MNKKFAVITATLAFNVLAAVISGCAANRVDIVDSGLLSLEQHATGKVYIAWSSAYKDGDGFVVTGVLRRRDTVGLPIKAHVDVTVLSPDGTVLDEASSSNVCVPRRITGRGQRFRRFRVHFPSIPAQGSSVRMVSHSGQHDDAVRNHPIQSQNCSGQVQALRIFSKLP